ncbi:MAG: hypothetical protein CFE24_01045 [Flavobacterium sp. BFFFF2]|nr:MAG: hypothetical protein CFE24_01045 [Flavobacterium sp. BFFFF2]
MKITKALSNQSILYFFIAFAGAYILFPVGFDILIQPSTSASPWWEALDTSWIITLNYISNHDFIWGKDFVFTYGPLGFLSTRFGWGASKYSFLLFDLFICLHWFLIFYTALKSSKSKLMTTLLIGIVALFLPIWIGSKISIYLLLFLTFWIRQSLESNKMLNYIMQISIIVVCFFIKFNTSLIGLFVFFLLIFYKFYTKEIKIKQLGILLATPLLFIYALSVYFKVSILAYMASGMELISGYNDIMYEEMELRNTYLYVVVISMVLCSLLIYNFFKTKEYPLPKRIIIVIITFIPFYIAYKQGFVRSNPDYNADFFASLLIFFVISTDLHFGKTQKYFNIPVVIATLLAVQFLYFRREKPFEYEFKMSKANYYNSFTNFNPNSDVVFKTNCPKFPPTIIEKVKNATIDSYPWNVRFLYENNLNYLPRPSIQAYSSYTPYLENLNFEFYNSKNAPEYVVYEYNTLDNRYPLFDESKVNVVLKENYQIDEVFDYEGKKLILLKKKADFRKIKFVKTNEYAVLMNAPFEPKDNVYYELDLYENMLGKAYSVLKHSPAINLNIMVEGDGKHEYKTSKKLLKTGIFGNNFFGETKDFYETGSFGQSNRKVVFYQFSPKDPSMFQDKIRVNEYKIIKE